VIVILCGPVLVGADPVSRQLPPISQLEAPSDWILGKFRLDLQFQIPGRNYPKSLYCSLKEGVLQSVDNKTFKLFLLELEFQYSHRPKY